MKYSIDIFLIAVIILGFILGYKDGFIRKMIGFTGFCLAVFLAIKFSGIGGKVLYALFAIETYLSEIIAGIIIFLIIILVFSILKRIIHPFDKVNGLINQVLGGIVGTVQILFFLSAVLYLLRVFNFPSKENANKSYLYAKVYDVIPTSVNLVRDYTPDTKKLLKNYVNGKDTLK